MERFSVGSGFLIARKIHYINCKSYLYILKILQEACSGIAGWMFPLRVAVSAGVGSVVVCEE